MEPDELIERFAFFEDWQERYRYIIDLGMKLVPLAEEHKCEANKVTGCMSQVWLVHSLEEGRVFYKGDSDSHIVKGLISVLVFLYSGKTPTQIIALDIEEVFRSIGLDQHLSPNRRNGFYSMVGRIRAVAEAGAA